MPDESYMCQNGARTTHSWDQELSKISTVSKEWLGHWRSWGLKHVSDHSSLIPSMLIRTAVGGFSPPRTFHLEIFFWTCGPAPFPSDWCMWRYDWQCLLQRRRLRVFPIMQNIQAQLPPASEKIPIHIFLNYDLTRSEQGSLGQMP